MPTQPSRILAFDASVLDQLACPACMGSLRLDANRLLCAACNRAYPIIDGIPVLIPSRAESKPA
jgi:uncharacterized protein YbaR (Trm112 family)